MPTLKESLNYEPVELNFGTSGLRGLVTDMTDLECYINTAGFLSFVKGGGSVANVLVAGDLRFSTPRIIGAVIQAIKDAGLNPIFCGFIPTPALAYAALQQQSPCIMVTGSHIPDDRNGIKFYTSTGEVLKSDEASIKEQVASFRQSIYGSDAQNAQFGADGMLLQAAALPNEDSNAAGIYLERYQNVFTEEPLRGKKVVMYQHSAVGRDMIPQILTSLGAEVVPVGRSEKFIPIDTENVTPDDNVYFKQLAQENPGLFAIISTDGDSDRPFVVDENGTFHRGDELGAVVADWLKAEFAAVPISSNDAVLEHLDTQAVPYESTKIGSPYVIEAMQKAKERDIQRVVGWEVNGGFLLGDDLEINGRVLKALPTRDAVLPIIVALLAAVDSQTKVSDVFARLPQRFTSAGLIDNFPIETAKKIVGTFSEDSSSVRDEIQNFFSSELGFGKVEKINSLDGVRIYFDNGDIAHIRPSGNAPQLRIYSVANSQERADEIVRMAVSEPDGIYRGIEKTM